MRGVFHERWNIIGTKREMRRKVSGASAHRWPVLLRKCGGSPGDRTQDSLIKSQVLYH